MSSAGCVTYLLASSTFCLPRLTDVSLDAVKNSFIVKEPAEQICFVYEFRYPALWQAGWRHGYEGELWDPFAFLIRYL